MKLIVRAYILTSNRIFLGLLRKRWFGWLILLFLFQVSVFGQSDKLQFRQITLDDGLPSMHIYDVLQDDQGYIWIATEAGLSRFDGYNFKNYSNRDGLPNVEVFYLTKDLEGRIWMTTIGEIAYIKEDSFYTIEQTKDEIPIGGRFLQLSDSTLLMASREKVFTLQEDGQLEEIFSTNRGKYQLSVTSMQKDDVAWLYNGIDLYKIKDGRLEYTFQVEEETNLNYYVAESVDGSLVLNSNKGLLLFDPEKEALKVIDDEVFLVSRISYSEGHVWVTGPEIGVIRYTLDEQHNVIDRYQSFTNSQVSDFLRDREGNYWISTMGNGLYFSPLGFDNAKVYTTQELLGSQLYSFFLDEETDKIWIGTRDNSLLEVQNGVVKKHALPIFAGRKYNSVRTIHKLSEEEFLLGTDVGLMRWKEGQTIRVDPGAIKSVSIHPNGSVLYTSAQAAYKTTIDRLLELGNSEYPLYYIEAKGVDVLLDSRSYEAFMDSKEQVWISNVSKGLIQIPRLGQKDTIFWNDKSSIFETNIVDIREMDDGIIAVASAGQGVILIAEDQYFQITMENGLLSDVCNNLYTDGRKVWVATNRGVVLIENILIRNNKLSYDLSSYTESNGLISNEINWLEKKDSSLYLATPSGLMIVPEQNLTVVEEPPRLIVNSIKINGVTQKKKANYLLNHDQNNLEIDLTGISYKSFGDIRFEYMLEGWNNSPKFSTNGQINFTNLDAGKYVFKVKAVGRGVADKDYKEIRFEIKPFFWHTWTAFFLRLFVLGIIILIVFRYASIGRDRRVLSKLVQEKTSELNQKVKDLAKANQKLKRSNKELEEFAHVVSHDLKTPLRSIGSFIQVLDRKLRGQIGKQEQTYMNFVVSGVQKMEEIIKDLLDMSTINAQSLDKSWIKVAKVLEDLEKEMVDTIRSKNAVIQYSDKLPEVYFNKTSIKQLFQNLIVNGIKYNESEQPIVEIGVEVEGTITMFFVKDNGIGIKEEYHGKIFNMFTRLHNDRKYDGTGIGLAICKKIVESNNGQIRLESEENKGTTFWFSLGTQTRVATDSNA